MARSWTSSVSARSHGSGEKFVNAAATFVQIPMAGSQALLVAISAMFFFGAKHMD